MPTNLFGSECEDWRVLLSYVSKGDFLFSFDLKPGYHHFDIFPDHQTFLGFSFFSFPVLSNIFALHGLSSAPYIFTKCLRPLNKFWRFNGVKIVAFLDDGRGKGVIANCQRAFFVCADFVKYCRFCG